MTLGWGTLSLVGLGLGAQGVWVVWEGGLGYRVRMKADGEDVCSVWGVGRRGCEEGVDGGGGSSGTQDQCRLAASGGHRHRYTLSWPGQGGRGFTLGYH